MTAPYEESANVERAVAFFKRPTWSRLLASVYDKYVREGAASGQVTLLACSAEEQKEIARFLNKRIPSRSDVTIRLADFQKALNQSGFACDLRALLAAYFPERPQITRREQREQRAYQQWHFSNALSLLADELRDGSPGKRWLSSGSHGSGALFRRYKNDSLEAQEHLLRHLRIIVDGLNHLPTPPSFERLALFARRISGDPHFLDTQTATGKLFLHALMDLAQLGKVAMQTESEDVAIPEVAPERLENDHWRLLLYYDAGLLLDTISSTAAAFHLTSAEDAAGHPDSLVASAGERILVLPLRQLLAWKKVLPASRDVYLFENPQVFEVVVDTLQATSVSPRSASDGPPLPTLICTAGWPSLAVLRLLSLLTESSAEVVLHYSGDFDLQGLRIAAHLLARFPEHCRLWCFDPPSYLAALHHQGAPLEVYESAGLHTLPEEFAPLAAAMRESGKKAHQEGVIPLLLQSIQNVSS
jgi:uncharacterized protein (TIGR02679 family)